MLKIMFVLTIVIGLNAADDINKTKMDIVNNTASPILTKHYKDANASDANISRWNTKAWEAEMHKNGLTSNSIIGNTMSIFGSSAEGKLANSGDLSKMKTSELQNNSAFAKNKSIGAFDSALQNVVMNDVANNAYGKVGTRSKKIKCYITRDIGQTYRCTAPGNSLMMSSGMGGRDAMSKLKNDCEGQCFTQSSCTNMRQNEQNLSVSEPSKAVTLTKSSPSMSFIINTMSNQTINTIDFNETGKGANLKYTVSYIDRNGKKITLIENLLSNAGSLQNFSLYIGDIAQSITFTAMLATPYADSINAKISIENISVNYHTNSQFVCPSVQDISNYLPGEFANICNNGKKTTLTRTEGSITKTFTICANSIYPGQNPDGSFYQRHACESVCRRQYECKLLAGGQINFEGLKGFREGCIENTSLDCNNFNNDCQQARLNMDAKIVNELVFGGNLRPVPTIVGGVATGVERPRLSLSNLAPTLGADGGSYSPNDIQFENQKKEEWKDKAYSDMMKESNWNVTLPRVGENTAANHAYGINLKSGSFYGFSGTSIRALMWRLKPAAFDVGSGTTFKLYAVVRAIVQNYRYDQSGTGVKRPYYDEIWYLKTNINDSFKPFYYNLDAYEIMSNPIDYNLTLPSYQPKSTSVGQYSTFDGTSWLSIGSSDLAESFKNEGFTATNAFWEYEILADMEAKYDTLPGIIKSIRHIGEYQDIPLYSGRKDFASGGTIVKLSVSTGYSSSALSYQNIKDMVGDGTITTIFETGNENLYPRYFRGDGEKDNNVAIYFYGKQGNGSAYFNIKPRKDHIGKKGFIFVYGE